MFGLEPSISAKKALEIFKEKKLKNILELGAGLGRDSIFFAENFLNIKALDYSQAGINIIYEKAKSKNLLNRISTKVHDVRKKLPFEDNSLDACYSHMLYCINGIHRGENLYENDGIIVQYFSKEKINSLLDGFKNISLENFEEGTFPRKLFFVVNEKK